MTYGGNEEIVLKGGKGARRKSKSRKRRQGYRGKKMFMRNDQEFFARIQAY
jgi:hypothetical protein